MYKVILCRIFLGGAVILGLGIAGLKGWENGKKLKNGIYPQNTFGVLNT
jgi:hypothetical protein